MSDTPDEPLMPTMDPAVWAVRSAFYTCVGQGISAWTSMEGNLVSIASYLMGTTEAKAGLVFYSINNFNSWLTIITDLFALAPEYAEFRDHFTALVEPLKQLNDTRVRLAHHTIWGSKDHASPALRPNKLDTRPKSKKHQPLVKDEISAFTDKVFHIEMRIVETLVTPMFLKGDRTHLQPAASPEKSGGPLLGQMASDFPRSG